jgi:amino acid adenylation domain-containing protein
MVEQQVDRSPDAEAFRFGRTPVSYRELDERANRLARALLAHGVAPGERVGVCLPRSAELIVALLAIGKTGGCYVPLDPEYPAGRIALMAADSAARLILTTTDLSARPGSSGSTTLCWESLDLAAFSTERPLVEVPPSQLAYVIYTSGSTGRPKGVAIEHRSVTALLRWVRDTFTPAELAGVLAATSICFDLSIFEIFGPLCWGGRFILIRDILTLPWLPPDAGVTLVNTVPSAMNELLAADAVPASVTTVCLAGEPLSAALADRIWRLPHLRRLLNLYGPSEDTTYSTWAETSRGTAPVIGRAIAGTQVYVLDDGQGPRRPGEEGELYLGGAGLARGYLNLPAETASRFVPDPFSDRPGGRMYRTGDRGLVRDDGQFDCLGRLDNQVKIRGYRIELEEVGAALAGCPGVRDAVASVALDPSGDRCLVGYLVAESDIEAETDRVLSTMADILPRYMVPARIVWLSRLPTTPNGKVDRSALPTAEHRVG